MGPVSSGWRFVARVNIQLFCVYQVGMFFYRIVLFKFVQACIILSGGFERHITKFQVEARGPAGGVHGVERRGRLHEVHGRDPRDEPRRVGAAQQRARHG